MTVQDPNANVAPVSTPPEPAPAPVPVAQAAPQPEPSAKVKAQAAHFARHPEEFQAVLDELEQAGVVDIRREIAEMKRKDFIRDVIDEIGLAKEDAGFITGNTPEQIKASATAYKARLDLYAAKAGMTGQVQTEPEVIPVNRMGQPMQPVPVNPKTPPPVIPEKRTGGKPVIDQAQADLEEALKGRTFV